VSDIFYEVNVPHVKMEKLIKCWKKNLT
jgi:hypothetical protein